MKRIFALSALGLLGAVLGCHHTAGTCDCDPRSPGCGLVSCQGCGAPGIPGGPVIKPEVIITTPKDKLPADGGTKEPLPPPKGDTPEPKGDVVPPKGDVVPPKGDVAPMPPIDPKGDKEMEKEKKNGGDKDGGW